MFLVALGLGAASAAIGGGTTGAAAAAGLCAVVVGAILYMPVYLLGVPLEETRELDRYRREVKHNRPPSPFYRARNGRSRALRSQWTSDVSQGQSRLEGYSSSDVGTPKIRCQGFSGSIPELPFGGVQRQSSNISVRRAIVKDHRLATRKENSLPISVKQQCGSNEGQQIWRSRSGILTVFSGGIQGVIQERFRKSLVTRPSKPGGKFRNNSNSCRYSLTPSHTLGRRNLKVTAKQRSCLVPGTPLWARTCSDRLREVDQSLATNESNGTKTKDFCLRRSTREPATTTAAGQANLSGGPCEISPELPKALQELSHRAVGQLSSEGSSYLTQHLRNHGNHVDNEDSVCQLWQVGNSTHNHFNCISTRVGGCICSGLPRRSHSCTYMHNYTVAATGADENDKWSVATTSTRSRSEEDWTSSRSSSSDRLL